MSVPFFPQRDAIVQRAHDVDGKLEHVLAPACLGNPFDPECDSLVYHEFGWDLLPMICDAGLRDEFVGLFWSLEYGHLGVPLKVVVTTK